MKMITINGVEVKVHVCKPSRRLASSSIQRPRFMKSQTGAISAARENGQYKE
jgi:hypothetical protein